MDLPPFNWWGVSGRAIGAAASAAALHAVGHRFESCIAHHFSIGKWRFKCDRAITETISTSSRTKGIKRIITREMRQPNKDLHDLVQLIVLSKIFRDN